MGVMAKFVFVLDLLFVLFAAASCVQAVCPAIDLASKACPAVVKYVDQYGHERTMTLSNDDAREMAATKASRHDAGAP